METSEREQAEADRLLAAAVYLMTCHARNGCPRLACMIRHHLQMIGRHPGAADHVSDMAQKLSAAWSAILVRDERIAMEARQRVGATGEGSIH